MPTIKDLKFREDKRQFFYHDLRAFVCGVEVSWDLRGSLAVAISDTTAPNTATLMLDNAADKYVFTDENARGFYGHDPFWRYSELAKRNIVARKLGTDGKSTGRDFERTISEAFNDVLKSDLRVTKNTDLSEFQESASVQTVKGAVNDLIQRLGSEFFNEKTKDQTRLTILKEVQAKFPNLDPAVLQKTTDSSLSNRGAFSQAADSETTSSGSFVVRPAANSTNPQDPDTGLTLYSFDPGDHVIGKHDPVVIYAHNPLSEADEWYPVFTGFVNTATERTDETTGESSITLQCYCIRALMKQMRISKNAALSVYQPDLVMQDIGYFSDVISANTDAWTTFLNGFSLEQTVCQLVTGSLDPKLNPDKTAAPSTDQQETANPGKIESGRVGRFGVGQILRYPQSNKAQDSTIGLASSTGGVTSDTEILEKWHSIAIFGSSNTDTTFITFDQVTQIGEASHIGGPLDPWSRQLHMLLPKSGTNVQTLTSLAVDDNQNQFQFANRWEIIRTAAQWLDYQFYTSPGGDLLLEFPFYDFTPDDFGPNWSSLFKYFGHLIESQATPESDNIPVGVVVTGALIPIAAASDAQAENTMLRVLSYSKQIAAKYGTMDPQYEHIPFLDDLERLKAYSALYYQRALANASSLSFTACHRPFLTPNRPILHQRRRRLGVSYAVEHTWEIPAGTGTGGVTTELSVKAVRKQIKKPDGSVEYRFVTGGTHLAISHRLPEISQEGPQVLEDGTAVKTVVTKNTSESGITTIDNSKAQASVQRISESNFSGLPANLDASRIQLAALDDDMREMLYQIATCVPDTAIIVTSGRRSSHQNDAVGGQSNSAHLEGKAVDIRIRASREGEPVREALSDAEKNAIADCVNNQGYDYLEETQATGPHIHIEKSRDSKKPRRETFENERAKAAAAKKSS